MDFKSLMSAQIAKSKSPADASSATSKYSRRNELEQKRQAEYAAEQERLEYEREERAAKKRKIEEEESEQRAIREAKIRKLAEESKIRREAEEAEEERRRRRRLGLPDLAEKPADSEDTSSDKLAIEDQPDIPDADLQIRLRELNEPAKLFAEDHKTRLSRYYKLSASQSPTSETNAIVKRTSGPIPTTLQPVDEKDMLLPSTPPPSSTSDPSAYTFLHRQLASYFSLLLTEWRQSLSLRSPGTKSSTTGRAAEQTYLSVLRDLTPLYRKLESQSLPSDLLKPLVEITRDIQSRRYVDANNGYLKLSIGKAAWPIGVTMVGIHERSARERIGAKDGDKMAHIMSDEVTRKMLQSVKRCLSFAQTRWPPDDLGQMMG